MTDTPEEECTCNDRGYEEFLERTLHSMFVGMEALEEVCDMLRAENYRLKSVIDMGSKKAH